MSMTAAARIRIPSLRPLRRTQRLSTILLIVALLSTVLSSVPASRAFASAQASRPTLVSFSRCNARPQQPLRAPRTTCAIAGPYRGFASTAPLGQALSSHANMSAAVKDAVTPALLREVRDFWFEHLTNPKALIMPSFEDNKRWFFGGAALDEACTKRFAPTLEAIRNSGVTAGSEILSAVGPLTDPCDWMSLIILLDQIPRNCYRGDAARVVFTEFDPLARDVALEAMAAGVPDGEPEIRWRFAYRNWFYMPLMHSEDVATHDKAVAEYEKMLADVKSLTDGAGAGAGATGDEYEARAREVVQADVETATKLAGLNLEFERKHYDIIKKFGRYPHRNKAMGREATKEEVEYLANGGETFSQ